MPSNTMYNGHMTPSTNVRASSSQYNGSANGISSSSGKANKEPSFALKRWFADKDGPLSEQLYEKYQKPSGNDGLGK